MSTYVSFLTGVVEAGALQVPRLEHCEDGGTEGGWEAWSRVKSVHAYGSVLHIPGAWGWE